MKAIVKYADGPGNVRVMDMPVPVPVDDEVLVAVKATGLCYSDMSIVKGEYKGRKPVPVPMILGHEASGVVVALGGKVRDFTIGDRVAFEPVHGCGRCFNCKSGNKNMCEDWDHLGITEDGTFAEFVKVPEVCVHKLPDSVSFEDAAILEPLSLVARSLDHVHPVLGETAVIIGPGSVGLLHLEALKAYGCKVILIGIEKDKKRFEIAETLGADRIVYTDKEDPVKAVLGVTKGRGAEIVVETASNPIVWDYLLDLVAPRGRVSPFGLYPEAKFQPIKILRKGITIFGDVASLPRHFMRALSWLETGKISSGPLITRRFSLDDVDEAFRTFYAGETVKVMFMV
jgi:threonine dehydrogenase-like Zn-dependent dehydrogenase